MAGFEVIPEAWRGKRANLPRRISPNPLGGTGRIELLPQRVTLAPFPALQFAAKFQP